MGRPRDGGLMMELARPIILFIHAGLTIKEDDIKIAFPSDEAFKKAFHFIDCMQDLKSFYQN